LAASVLKRSSSPACPIPTNASRRSSPSIIAHRLTKREREVLAWSAVGKSAWDTGEILNITQRTVEEHLANCRRKLGAMNRTHAVAIAIRDRIIEP
jgi:LuxR family transcriptional regulator, quorum-sensing system regulator BjaR1